MKDFILLHYNQNNSIVGINVNNIVCAAFTENKQCTQLYIEGEEDITYFVNETPTLIMKQAGDARKFILVHSRSTNNDVIIPKDIIRTVKEYTGGSIITINNSAFADFDVNEKATSVIDMLNN